MYCNSCNEEKTRTSFSKSQQRKNSGDRRCKSCVSGNTVTPTRTNNATKQCSECNNSKPKSSFSVTQWKKPNSKCKKCINPSAQKRKKRKKKCQECKKLLPTSQFKRNSRDCNECILGNNLPLPYEDCLGSWIPREDFFGRKSFAFYKCNSCRKRWMSSRGFKDHRQACKNCERYVYPDFMWENENYYHPDSSEESSNSFLEDNEIPHMSQYCEACRLGVCDE
eukprot:TRINITY_DN11899_c0_g1_i1.p1 TRINITY_DN11899_c0_g1~~TRINITY_DN11899_c0_g1_i1.p1  ORF type:complete len:223 (+),score=28.03 TRINITY_DN11899_c0_g1_i1:85-753(+)